MTEQPADYPERWSTAARPDFGGMSAYVMLIRAEGDPDETSYKKVGKDGRNKYEKGVSKDSLAWAKIKKMPVNLCKVQILQYFEALDPDSQTDGVTFNRMCVELWRRTADVLHESNQQEAVWQLVESGLLEHTMEAPILFRLVDETDSPTGRRPARPNLPERAEPTGDPILTNVDFEEVELRTELLRGDPTMTMFAKAVDAYVHVAFDPARPPRVMGESEDGSATFSDALIAVDATVEAASAEHVQLIATVLYIQGGDPIEVEELALVVQASVCTSMQFLDDGDGDDDDGGGEDLDEEEEEEAEPPPQARAARARSGRPRHLRAVAIR